VERAIARAEARLGDPDERAEAATEIGWLHWLHRGDTDLARGYFAGAVEAGVSVETQLGAAETSAWGPWADEAVPLFAGLLEHPAEPIRRLALSRLRALSDRSPLAAPAGLEAAERLLPVAMGAFALDLEEALDAWSRQVRGASVVRHGLAPMWRVWGPLDGPLVSRFEEDLQTSLGPDVAVREVPSADAAVHVHPREGGLFVLEADVDAGQGGSFVWRLDTEAMARVLVDGQEVMARRTRLGYPARRLDALVALEPGLHRVTVVVATDRANERVAVAAAPLWAPASQASEEAQAALPPLLRRWALAWLALDAQDPERARAELAAVEAEAPRWPALAWAKGQLARFDPALPPEQREDAARLAWRDAVNTDPLSILPAVALADQAAGTGAHETAMGEVDRALAALEEIGARSRLLAVARARLLADAGLYSDALALLEGVIAEHPGCCPALSALAGIAWTRDPVRDGLAQSAGGLAGCPALEHFAIRDATRRGDVDTALRLLAEERATHPDDEGLFRAEVRARVIAGDTSGAVSLLDARAARFPGVEDYAVEAADVLAGAGRREQAFERFDRVAADGGASAESRRRLALLGLGALWERFAVDGRALAEASFDQTGPNGASAVYLLDDLVTVLLPGGASAWRTHYVIQVASEAAVAEVGEVAVAPEAEVLFVRSFKADGRIKEPEDIAEKDTLSLTGLEVGDVVEIATIRFDDGPPRLRGRRLADSFYFQSFQAPVRRSRWVLVAPDTLPVETWVDDTVPPAIEAAEISDVSPGYRARIWQPVDQPAARIEPLELTPSARIPRVVAATASWEDLQRDLHDRVTSLTRVPPDLDRAILAATASASGERERAEAVFRLVRRAVAEEVGESFEVPAEHIWARGRGDRTILLRAALARAGLPARVVLIEPAASHDPELAQAPTLGRYTAPVCVAGEGPAEVWLDLGAGDSEFDYLRPTLQGRPTFDIERPLTPFGVSPAYPLERERHTVNVDVVLAPDDKLRGRVTEALQGQLALDYRAWFVAASDAERQDAIESLLQASFPGATVGELTLEGLSLPDDELRLRYDFEAPARATKGELAIGLLPDNLGRNWAVTGARTTPLLIDAHTDLDATFRISVQGAARLDEGPAPVDIDTRTLRYSRHATRSPDGRTVEIHKRWTLPLQILPPEAYPRFQELAAQVDAADRVRLRVLPLPVASAR
jgi:hypothetical protein